MSDKGGKLEEQDKSTLYSTLIAEREEPDQVFIEPEKVSAEKEPLTDQQWILESIDKWKKWLTAAKKLKETLGLKLKDRKVRVDPSVNPTVRDAIRRLFGIDSDTITYEMFQKCLEIRSKITQENRQSIFGKQGGE